MTQEVNIEDIGGKAETQPKVGAYLRQTRESRGLTIEGVARSLKLNPKQIESLEAERFDEFPAPPYIRVYLRAVAKHLGLDPKHVLKIYRQQRGLTDSVEEEGFETKVDLSVVPPSKSAPPWGLILILLGILVLVGIIANQMHFFAPRLEQPVVETPADSTAAPADSILSAPADSLDTPPDDSLAPAPAPSEEPEAETEADEPDSLILSLSAVKDSVWAQVFRDGRSWNGFVKAGKPRVFRAVDSLNILVGQNTNLRYTLNGEPLVPAEHKGVAAFRVDHEQLTNWSQTRWKRVFGNR